MGNKSNLINLRVQADLRKQLQQKANQHTAGNISEWLRIAGTQHIPKIKIKAS